MKTTCHTYQICLRDKGFSTSHSLKIMYNGFGVSNVSLNYQIINDWNHWKALSNSFSNLKKMLQGRCRWLHCTCDSTAVRATWIHIDKELMWHPPIWWESSSKSKHREQLVWVVILDDAPNSWDSLLIGIWHITYVVQRLWWGRVTIWTCDNCISQNISTLIQNVQ